MSKVWLIGDLIVDCFHHGEINRLAPEAPVPILVEDRVEIRPGGAGNVAASLQAMGIDVGFWGGFREGDYGPLYDEVKNALFGVGVRCLTTPGFTGSPDIKHRFVARNHGQMKYVFQWDELGTARGNVFPVEALDEGAKHGLPDLIVVCDYNKGFLTGEIIQGIIQWGNKRNIDTVVDAHPKTSHLVDFKLATLVKMNRSEFDQICGSKCRSPEHFEERVSSKCKMHQIHKMVVTQDREGLTFCDKNEKKVRHYPTEPSDVADVCGAGDSVLASLVYSTLEDHTYDVAMRLANSVAGWSVQQFGTAVVTKDLIEGLIRPMGSQICMSVDRVNSVVKAEQAWGHKVVFTNGCFDLLHSGHIYLLEEAKKRGDFLIVAVNTDKTTRKLKGANRPVLNQQQRAKAVSALTCVDRVMLQTDYTPNRLLELLQPDVLVKGSSSTLPPVGSDVVEAYGGEVAVIEVRDDISTTRIVDQISMG